MSRVCIIGAGAIGGFIGTRLAAAGNEVSAVARGATLQALRQHGWRMTTAEGLVQAKAAAVSESTRDLGPQAGRLAAQQVTRPRRVTSLSRTLWSSP